MTDLNALLVFAKVVEANSFSEAARRLGAPVSTVSRRVAELEERLGVRLLERSTRRLRLTDVGADVMEHAARAAELDETVESVVSRTRTDVVGVLRLSAPPSLSDVLLVPLLGAFQAAHPKVRASAFVTQRLVDPLTDGIDVMLRVGDLKDSTLVARTLARYRHRLVASPVYLAAAGRPAHPRELSAHRLVAFGESVADGAWTFVQARRSERFTLPFAPALAMNDYAGVAAAARAGLGVAELPPMVADPMLESGALVEVARDWRLPERALSLVHRGGPRLSRPVEAFKEIAIRHAPGLIVPTRTRRTPGS